MMVVPLAEAFRHEEFDFLANQFVALVAKQLFCLLIDLDYRAIAINGDDGVWKGLQEIARQGGPRPRFWPKVTAGAACDRRKIATSNSAVRSVDLKSMSGPPCL
jgi:hypothetical protein